MNDLITPEFDYSVLSTQQLTIVKFCESEIDDILRASSYHIGKILIKVKEELGHGHFGDWLQSNRWGWSERTAQKMINIAINFKSAETADLFPNRETQALLAAPSTPEAARERAIEAVENGDVVTHAKAKEIIEKEKQIEAITKKCEELEEKLSILSQPQTYEIIPDLQNILHELMPATIRKFSTWTPEAQSDWHSQYMGKKFAENQNNDERRKAQIAQEKAMKAIEEKESAIAKMAEVTNNPNTAQIIANHEIDLKNMKAQYKRDLEAERVQMAKAATEFQAKQHRDRIKKAEEDKALAEKREQEMRDKANAAWGENDKLERDIKKLQAQLEVDNPTNVDAVMEKQVRGLGKSILFTLKELKNDWQRIGGGMENSITAFEQILEEASLNLSEIKGLNDQIITIEG